MNNLLVGLNKSISLIEKTDLPEGEEVKIILTFMDKDKNQLGKEVKDTTSVLNKEIRYKFKVEDKAKKSSADIEKIDSLIGSIDIDNDGIIRKSEKTEIKICKCDMLASIRKSIDSNRLTFDFIFQDMCTTHINCCDKGDEEDSFEKMINTLESLFTIKSTQLEIKNKKDFNRRDKVYKNFLSEKKEFSGQWDKMKHFFKGAWVGHIGGESIGAFAGWITEKADSLKRPVLDALGKRQSHQVGFDWQDYEWTEAGAVFGDTLTDLSSEKAKIIMNAFSTGKLSISNLFKPVITDKEKEGYGSFDPMFSPGFETTIDKIEDNTKSIRKKIEELK